MQKTWELIYLVYKYLLLWSIGAGGGGMIGEERGLVNFVPQRGQVVTEKRWGLTSKKPMEGLLYKIIFAVIFCLCRLNSATC